MAHESRLERIENLVGASIAEQVVWIRLDDWQVADTIKERCGHGITWIDGRCYAKDATTGVTIGCVAGGVNTLPPKADVEAAARRLLEEALAELHERTQHSIAQMRAAITAQGGDPDEIIRQAAEREAAEERRAAKLNELGRRLEDLS